MNHVSQKIGCHEITVKWSSESNATAELYSSNTEGKPQIRCWLDTAKTKCGNVRGVPDKWRFEIELETRTWRLPTRSDYSELTSRPASHATSISSNIISWQRQLNQPLSLIDALSSSFKTGTVDSGGGGVEHSLQQPSAHLTSAPSAAPGSYIIPRDAQNG